MDGDVSIIAVDGRVDSAGAVVLNDALHRVVDDNNFKIILEMSNIRYLNSAGLRTMADILTHSRENGGNLHLVAPNDKIRRVLAIIGFDNFFKIFDDIESALEAI
jgi:anti-anti-sigma factor